MNQLITLSHDQARLLPWMYRAVGKDNKLIDAGHIVIRWDQYEGATRLRLVATNGYVLVIREIKGVETDPMGSVSGTVFVDGKWWWDHMGAAVKKKKVVTLAVTDNSITIGYGDSQAQAINIKKKFPQWQRYLPMMQVVAAWDGPLPYLNGEFVKVMIASTGFSKKELMANPLLLGATKGIDPHLAPLLMQVRDGSWKGLIMPVDVEGSKK